MKAAELREFSYEDLGEKLAEAKMSDNPLRIDRGLACRDIEITLFGMQVRQQFCNPCIDAVLKQPHVTETFAVVADCFLCQSFISEKLYETIEERWPNTPGEFVFRRNRRIQSRQCVLDASRDARLGVG